MKKILKNTARTGLTLVFGCALAGCATSVSGGAAKSHDHVNTILDIADSRDIRLNDYEGVALVSLAKVGVFGFAIFGESVSVYVKNPKTKSFGPPVFRDGGGLQPGLLYAGLNVADCLLLFKNAQTAIRFAEDPFLFNFSNEISFGAWGRKSMTRGPDYYSDGAGLSLGAIEIELGLTSARDGLHGNLYGGEKSVRRILLGDVKVPPELRSSIDKLNAGATRFTAAPALEKQTPPASSTAQKLAELKQMVKDGLITQEEYDVKAKKLIDQL